TRQIGQAIHQSETQASRLLSAAHVLTEAMPHTFTELRRGNLTEYRALTIVKESAGLEPGDRRRVDEKLHEPNPTDRLKKPVLEYATRTIARETRRFADAVNPAARATWAQQNARQSVGVQLIENRAVPGYATLQAYLPVAQGAAIMDYLQSATENTPTGGRGQAMVNILTAAIINNTANSASGTAIPITLNLVMTDQALFGVTDEPAEMIGHSGRGYGYLPAPIARHLTAKAIDAGAAWLRRLYQNPAGQLIAMTSTQRYFTGALADAIRIRDHGTCTTPWCGAPARHTDHIKPHSKGGQTTYQNATSLCAKCNLTKGANDP
ncbi:MAG: HNH endonuclease, partial [Promicromonosporaceae bacterium]|nr:HNH endonuclease [Promicromonosporaceae bacterium]